MKGLMKHLVLAALVVMSGVASLPVCAAQERPHCNVTDGVIPFKNIILRAGTNFHPGDVLYTSNYTIHYTCVVTGDGPGIRFYPTLSEGENFRSVITLLQGLGLGMNMTVTEDGYTPVTIKWADLTTQGWRKTFGKEMLLNTSQGATENPLYYFNYKRSATVTLELFVAQNYPDNSVVSSIPQVASFMYIRARTDLNDVKGTPLSTSGFAIRVLSPALTRAEINPSTVSLGHFIKASETSLTRSGNFSVTVRQQNPPSPGQKFELPLNITFGTGILSAIDGQHLALKNLDGNENGLQLSIKDRDNGDSPVEFNKETSMGTLSVTGNGAGINNITKRYAIEVSRRSGMEVQTGKFRGAIPVTITYS
ncbi:TPA: hypothetical protein ACIAPS_004154 [Salmonella enterica subsp. enterica serovar Bovismorbificans]